MTCRIRNSSARLSNDQTADRPRFVDSRELQHTPTPGTTLLIKFRCHYCHQFLGIARSRAGELTVCPTCGRTIQIPGDGSPTSHEAPAAETPPGGEGYATALQELAVLLQPEPNSNGSHAGEPEEGTSLAPPEPIPLEIAGEVEPIVLSAESEWNSLEELDREQPGDSQPVAYQVTMRDDQFRDLIGLLAPVGAAPADRPVTRNSIVRSRDARMFLLGGITTLLLAAVVGLAAGLGRPPAPVEPSSQPVVETSVGIPVRGKISVRSADGSTQADAGAIVVVLPEQPPGKFRLPTIGLRPGDDDVDFAAAAAVIESWGGFATQTDAAGAYQGSLAKPGRYQAVALSAIAQSNSPTATNDATKSLTGYFTDPVELLGTRAVHLAPLTIKTQAPVSWDYVHEPGSSGP